MRLIRAALEFRMELDSDEEVLSGKLDRLDDILVGGGSADHKTLFQKSRAKIVVELITVTMALENVLGLIAPVHFRAGSDLAGVCAEAERASLIDAVALVGKKIDDLVRRIGVELAGVCVGIAADVSCKLDNGNLHSEADSEVGDIVLARVLCGGYHALDAAASEASGDDYAAVQKNYERK